LRIDLLHLQAWPTLLGVRTKSSRGIPVLLATAALILAGPPAAGASTARSAFGCRGANARPTPRNLGLIRSATLCLIDQARASVGARPLRANRSLQTVAENQAVGMVRFDYFADVSPTGKSPAALIHATRYAARASLITGEDIGWGTGYEATAEEMVNTWLQSPPHREIMLDSAFRNAGIGVIAAVPSFVGSRRGATYAIEFGARLR
jgi:uncharacterized protein YkwD